MSKPSLITRCPICARRVATGGSPQRCFRCDTLHHHSCWEYVPGCAVIGCTGAETQSTEGWARMVGTRIWRLRAIRLLLWNLYLGLAAGIAVLVDAGWLALVSPVLQFTAAVAGGALLATLLLTGEVARYGADTLPLDPPGNDKVRRTLEQRELGWLPARPLRVATSWTLVTLLYVLGVAAQEAGWKAFLATLMKAKPRFVAMAFGSTLGPLFVFVFLLVRFSASFVAREQVFVNRLRVSVVAVRRQQVVEDDEAFEG